MNSSSSRPTPTTPQSSADTHKADPAGGARARSATSAPAVSVVLPSVRRDHGPWVPDVLGEGYQATTLSLGPDPDGEGEIVATVVRPPEVSRGRPLKRAALYVHGMSDYFFHTHLVDHCREHGIDLFGVDLRKCGRSHRAGQSWHDVSDVVLYDDDLNAALALLIEEFSYESVDIFAHSTGGLIVAGWLGRLHRRQGSWRRLHGMVRSAIFNSPWFDLQVPDRHAPRIRRMVSLLGRSPSPISMRLRENPTYGHTLHQDFGGEWTYDLEWKPLAGQPKSYRWLSAILDAQADIHNGEVSIGVPGLVLCSTDSRFTSGPGVDAGSCDVVLNVEQIQNRSRCIGSDITIKPIRGAIHDVFLSKPGPRAEAFKELDEFFEGLGNS